VVGGRRGEIHRARHREGEDEVDQLGADQMRRFTRGDVLEMLEEGIALRGGGHRRGEGGHERDEIDEITQHRRAALRLGGREARRVWAGGERPDDLGSAEPDQYGGSPIVEPHGAQPEATVSDTHPVQSADRLGDRRRHGDELARLQCRPLDEHLGESGPLKPAQNESGAVVVAPAEIIQSLEVRGAGLR
jgi:hypothetical protein